MTGGVTGNNPYVSNPYPFTGTNKPSSGKVSLPSPRPISSRPISSRKDIEANHRKGNKIVNQHNQASPKKTFGFHLKRFANTLLRGLLAIPKTAISAAAGSFFGGVCWVAFLFSGSADDAKAPFAIFSAWYEGLSSIEDYILASKDPDIQKDVQMINESFEKLGHLASGVGAAGSALFLLAPGLAIGILSKLTG